MKLRGNKTKLLEELAKLEENKMYAVSIMEIKDRRTIDQNNYYWDLLDQYAEYIGISKMEMHHIMIASYGQRMDGFVIEAPIDYDYTLETSKIYLRPTGRFGYDEDGNEIQYHFICRGSSEYNTKEMSILIDGLIQDIKTSEAPIETMTYNERQQLWGLA